MSLDLKTEMEIVFGDLLSKNDDVPMVFLESIAYEID